MKGKLNSLVRDNIVAQGAAQRLATVEADVVASVVRIAPLVGGIMLPVIDGFWLWQLGLTTSCHGGETSESEQENQPHSVNLFNRLGWFLLSSKMNGKNVK